MLDKASRWITMKSAGPEDRALLRSNPSAAAGVGMRTSAAPTSPPMSPLSQARHPDCKAKNLGVWGRAPVRCFPSGVPFGNIGGGWEEGFCGLMFARNLQTFYPFLVVYPSRKYALPQ